MLADWVCIIFTLDWVRDSCGTDTQKALAWIAKLYDTEADIKASRPIRRPQCANNGLVRCWNPSGPGSAAFRC